MKTGIRGFSLVIGMLAVTSIALAQPPGGGRMGGGPGGPGPGRGMMGQQEPGLMTYELAATAMAAAEAHARENGWNVSILIVDQNDNPVMMHRLGDVNPFTANVAAMKTLVSTQTGLTSADYAAKLQAGEIEEIPGGATFGGGVPVYIDGEQVGAIAASGVQPGQDEAVSRAGAEAIGSTTTD